MTAAPLTNRDIRPIRREAATHLFEVGQAVRLKSGFGVLPKPSDIYRIMATLPPRGNALQYRLRNDDERHERVMTEDGLELVVAAAPSEGASLMEATFGRLQDTDVA